MKINDETKKALIGIPVLIILILIAYFIDSYFESPKELNIKCMKGRTVLLNFMNEAKKTKDSATFTTIVDSCREFIDDCPDKEIDSLKNFIPFFIKLTDDYSHDVVNALKDSGEMDTMHLFRQTTIAEVRQLCSECNYNYFNFARTLDAEAIAAQRKRNTMQAAGSPAEITAMLRNKVLASQQKKDSVEFLFYKRAFPEKQ